MLDWGRANKTTLLPLITLQNKAVRTHEYTKTKTDVLYSKHKLWEILDLFKLSVAKFMYSFCSGGLPNHIDNYFAEIASVHKYQTRFVSLQKCCLPRKKTSLCQLSLTYIVPKISSDIPENLKSSSPYSFGKQYKNFLLSCKNSCWSSFYMLVTFCFIVLMPLLPPIYIYSCSPHSLYIGMLFNHCFLCCLYIYMWFVLAPGRLKTWPRWSFANSVWFNMLEHDSRIKLLNLKFLMYLYFHQHEINSWSLTLLFSSCCIRVTSWFESQKCMDKPYHGVFAIKVFLIFGAGLPRKKRTKLPWNINRLAQKKQCKVRLVKLERQNNKWLFWNIFVFEHRWDFEASGGYYVGAADCHLFFGKQFDRNISVLVQIVFQAHCKYVGLVVLFIIYNIFRLPAAYGPTDLFARLPNGKFVKADKTWRMVMSLS